MTRQEVWMDSFDSSVGLLTTVLRSSTNGRVGSSQIHSRGETCHLLLWCNLTGRNTSSLLHSSGQLAKNLAVPSCYLGFYQDTNGETSEQVLKRQTSALDYQPGSRHVVVFECLLHFDTTQRKGGRANVDWSGMRLPQNLLENSTNGNVSTSRNGNIKSSLLFSAGLWHNCALTASRKADRPGPRWNPLHRAGERTSTASCDKTV